MAEYTFIYNKLEIKLINKLINNPVFNRHWWDESDDEDGDPFFRSTDDDRCTCGLTDEYGKLKFFVRYSMPRRIIRTKLYDKVPKKVEDSGITIKIIKEE